MIFFIEFLDREVSIHAPARGATLAEVVIAYVIGRFNPRAREGRDLETIGHTIDFTEVSIHAPARGATRRKTRLFKQANVSIHAPARGATQEYPMMWVAENVSIHAPARGATEENSAAGKALAVSIHAPARGATCRNDARRRSHPSFNPRAREGRDGNAC